MLWDEKLSSLADRDRVIEVVAHELAHMWFGNLVTLEWWTDLWLNEGKSELFYCIMMVVSLFFKALKGNKIYHDRAGLCTGAWGIVSPAAQAGAAARGKKCC